MSLFVQLLRFHTCIHRQKFKCTCINGVNSNSVLKRKIRYKCNNFILSMQALQKY